MELYLKDSFALENLLIDAIDQAQTLILVDAAYLLEIARLDVALRRQEATHAHVQFGERERRLAQLNHPIRRLRLVDADDDRLEAFPVPFKPSTVAAVDRKLKVADARID